MRIIYVSDSSIPSQTANSVQVMKMCEALSAHAHSLDLLCRTGPLDSDPFVHYGVKRTFVIRPQKSGVGLGQVLYAREARGIVREVRPDLLIGRNVSALATMTRFRIPIALEVHDVPVRSNNRVKDFIFRALTRHVVLSASTKLVICISEALRQEYASLYPDAEHKLLVCPDGANPRSRRASRQLEPSDPASWKARVGYVGSLYVGRGIEMILRLAASIPEADFHLVGGGDPEIMKSLRGSSPPNLHIHGAVPHSEVPDWIDAFDVVLAPYQELVQVAGGGGNTVRWMSPLKIFEYMAQGKPIVASDLPSLREVLRSDRNAILAHPESSDDWERALRALLRDENLRSRLGKRALDDLIRHYTWGARAKRILGAVKAADPTIGDRPA